MPTKVTRDDLDSFVADNQLTIIDFWAPWCGPCKIMDRIINDLEAEFPEVRFGKFNVDDNQAIAEQYHVFSIPSLVVFKNGKATEKVSGIYPATKLAEFIERKLAEVQSK